MKALKNRRVEPRGLNRVEAADYLGISPSKFDELRKRGLVSPPKVIDGRKAFDLHRLDEDFDAFPDEEATTAKEWKVAV